MKARYLALAAGAAMALAAGAAIAAVIVAGVAAPAEAAPARTAAAKAAPARTAAAKAAPARTAASPGQAAHVVIVGIPGLRWSDVSPGTELYRIAGQGSAGTLVEFALKGHTCPADGWLTLNAGTRAGVDHAESQPCPPMPTVDPATGTVSGMNGIVNYNNTLDYSPQWGLLASGAGNGCGLAVGEGAALALANANGKVSRYLPSPSTITKAALARCPLTVVDLGALPIGPAAARAAAVQAKDAQLKTIAADLPPDTTLLVASPGALDKAQLGVVVIDGPGYQQGQLNARSTRQPGIVVITDLTPTVLRWLGHPDASLSGAQVTRGDRGSLAATVKGFTGRETAEQVWTSSHSPFFWAYALADAAALAAVGLIFWGATEERRAKRAKGWRAVGVFAAALPAGTFLANLVPWSQQAHPALWLYGFSVVFGLIIGLAALGLAALGLAAFGLAALPFGKRDPFAPFGLICLFTVLVLGIDVMTGSRLQLQTPFGLSLLQAGRFYGIGNEALGIYGIAALAGAGWLALRIRHRKHALIAVAIVAVFTVFASGWPGFGGKAGGTISIVPCFLVLLLVVGGLRLTWRRALAIAVSGLVLLAIFGLINHFVPATGNSDIGSFAGGALHGKSSSGDLLLRKIHSNIGSLAVNAFSPLIPVVLVLSGLMLGRPAWFRIKAVPLAFETEPLLPAILGVMWLMALLGWFANDSGVIVPASAMPFALPLAIALLAAAACHEDEERYPDTAVAGPSVAGQTV